MHLVRSCSLLQSSDDPHRRGRNGADLIFETPLRQAPPTSTVRIANVLTQVISAFEVNHRTMARAYLESEGLRVVDEGSGLSATDQAGRSLTITFDDMGRITGVTTRARGAR